MASTPLKKILYAEDEPDIREIVKIALEIVGGLEVKYCANGKELIEAAQHFTPDLVLLDVMMPEMDGPTTLKELRKIPNYKNVPVIFMTAKIQPSEIDNYKSMGAIDVITKPFDPMKLIDTLKNIWAQPRTDL